MYLEMQDIDKYGTLLPEDMKGQNLKKMKKATRLLKLFKHQTMGPRKLLRYTHNAKKLQGGYPQQIRNEANCKEVLENLKSLCERQTVTGYRALLSNITGHH
jgi:hypothetical protein